MRPGNYPCLSRLAENDDLWKHVENFDVLLEPSNARLPPEADNSQSARIARGLHKILFSHFVLMLVFRFKAREIVRGAIDADERENLLVMFNLARAFLEHTASLAFQVRALEKVVEDLEATNGFEPIMRKIDHHVGVAERLYYGGEKSPKKIKRIHVNELLTELAALCRDAPSDYENLCEFVHPNYGSNLLVSSGEISTGEIGAPSTSMKGELEFARVTLERYSALDWEFVIRASRLLSRLDTWVKIASTKGAKPSQIFSVRTSHAGDGKSKESAIYFKKARTHEEAIHAFYTLLKQKKIALHARRLVAKEGEYIFDIALTDAGPLWVKYRITEEYQE